MNLLHWCGVGLFCLSGFAQAELEVIADLGGQPVAPYFDAINNLDNEFTPSQLALSVAPTPVVESAVPITEMLPVATPELSPGYVVSRELDLPGLQPIFLIGDDERSRNWLEARHDSLLQLQAIGLVVNVTRSQVFEELQRLGAGLTLLPVSGSDLAKRLGLQHYPVLISDKGLEQ